MLKNKVCNVTSEVLKSSCLFLFRILNSFSPFVQKNERKNRKKCINHRIFNSSERLLAKFPICITDAYWFSISMSARQFKPELNELKINLLNYSDGKNYGNPFFFSLISNGNNFSSNTQRKNTHRIWFILVRKCTTKTWEKFQKLCMCNVKWIFPRIALSNETEMFWLLQSLIYLNIIIIFFFNNFE